MAKAAEKQGKATSMEEELSCPICLSLYRDPVSLSCGHSFCKECIYTAFDAQQAQRSCPVCKLQLGPVLELQKNFQLCSIVEAFLATTSKGQQDESSAEGKKEVVLCDCCLDLAQPAVKICLICDASLCEAHVNKHNSRASQQDHILVEVGAGRIAEEKKCLEHGRLLECYCQDEGQCICMLCSIAGCHKGHTIVSLKEAYDKQLGELWKMVRRLKTHRSTLVAALGNLQKNEDQLKTNTKTVTSQVQKLFEEMKTEMIQKEKNILTDIQFNEKEKLEEIAKLKKEMEKSSDQVAEHLQALQKIRDQPDKLLFFKEFKLAKEGIANKNFSQIVSVTGMDVAVVQLDQVTTDRLRCLMRDCLIRLDLGMYELQDELANQIKWNSGPSDTDTSPQLNDLFPWFKTMRKDSRKLK